MIAERLQGTVRKWLESPSPPRGEAPHVARKCGDCDTWCLGADKDEAAGRLASHRERCHG